jgi:dsDNA-specific endonuclease/ATPase MutS2
MSNEEHSGEDELEWELGDELDLHTFAPSDVAALIPDYIDECVARGYTEVRIVHGKGRGTLRRIVHVALERHPRVVSYVLAPSTRGGWGATLVVLES